MIHKKFSIAVVLCYNPNTALLINIKSGEVISQKEFDMELPSCLTYLDKDETLIVGTNNIESYTSKLHIFKLVNDQGIFGFHEVEQKFLPGALMDLKSFERVQEQFVVIGINSYVELCKFKDKQLHPLRKVENQIGVFKIQIL